MGAQFYPNCAHVEIINDSPDAGQPGPLVKIPGVYVWGQPGKQPFYLHSYLEAASLDRDMHTPSPQKLILAPQIFTLIHMLPISIFQMSRHLRLRCGKAEYILRVSHDDVSLKTVQVLQPKNRLASKMTINSSLYRSLQRLPRSKIWDWNEA